MSDVDHVPLDEASSDPSPNSDAAHRTYILDTNVLLFDPQALFVIDEHDLLLPMTVIEEIDRFKRDDIAALLRETAEVLGDLLKRDIPPRSADGDHDHSRR